jgi:transglutaminase-like putative cysteine protease
MRVAARSLLACTLVASASVAAAAPFRVVPPPAWVEPIAPDLSRDPATDASGGLEYLLVEDQVRIGPSPAEHYRHLVRRVLSPKGVENGSEVRIDFNPAYQELLLHRVTIHRGRTRLDALRPRDVKLIQRETELDRRLFDGALTAVLFLRDVRQGDVIETAWTVRGENPVFGGRWMGSGALAYSVPVAESAYRLVTPAGRTVSHRVHGVELAPTVTRRSGTTEYLWRRSRVPATLDEGDLPPGLDAFAWLEISEWPDWAAVVEWALPLYARDPPSAEMQERIAIWRTLPDPAARAQAALRFVQDEIRYLGIELGASSHRPHAPAEVLARRFGDCKDKALLLASLLGALGIDAAPALVNAEDRGAVEAWLPSPFAFDHVIVRATIGGEVSWLDPTRSLERGPLAAIAPPPYGRALVIAPGERGLTTLPEPAPAPLRVETTLRVWQFGAPAELEIATTYEGMRAVRMRHELAESTPAELQQHYLEFYARRYPGIAVAAALGIEDAPDADRLTVRERYVLAAIGAGDDRAFTADAIREAVRPPEKTLRKLPLRVAYPVAIDERIRVELPGPPALVDEVRRVTAKAARLTRTARRDGNAYVVDLAYRSLTPTVEPGAITDHLAALGKMRDVSDFRLALALAAPRDWSRGGELAPLALAGIVIGGLVLFVGVSAAFNGDLRRWWRALANKRRQRAFRAKFRPRLGDSPEAPIAVRAEEGIGPAVGRLRCGCGAALPAPSSAPQAIRLGGRTLGVHVLGCVQCGEARHVYFEVVD